jgi:hypothetical protein
MTTKTTTYGKGKMENCNGILETATPHPALSRKGGGNKGVILRGMERSGMEAQNLWD